MHVILQGSLKHFPAAELLPLLARHDGTLDVQGKSRRTRVFFQGGRIVGAEAKEQLDASEVVLDLFVWPDDASFTFLDSVDLPAGAQPLALDVAALTEEGTRRAALPRLDLSLAYRVIDDPAGDVNLTADEFKLLFRIGAGRSLGQLANDLGKPAEELHTVIQRLESIGLVARVELGESTAASDPVVSPDGPTTQVKAPSKPLDPTSVAIKKSTSGGSVKTSGMRKRPVVGSLTEDGDTRNVWPLIDDEYFIGRDPSNPIILPDASVSSRHARITRTQQGFLLEDLRSRNGTFVNGEKLAEPRKLVDNDLLRLGKIILTFNQAKELTRSETTQREKPR